MSESPAHTRIARKTSVMSREESSEDFKFKRDLSHVFDALHSYDLRNKCKKRNKLIRVYTGYITNTGAMDTRD